ncbi:CapA family protein [Vibrio parahaemolyticus]|uniref:Capsule biosynthesis protein CapA n=1 Tax=Vibrio parahaemolyticus TaxID=670 RepID=A0A7M1VMG1_VIBPH|nr:CapA family protein [Vibrio parahaemolyticus]MDF5515006.1 CapA family protein [Vibrio parahaemolyticus]MDF5520162.1 CapA family protein [Vibrio parahaemolyticus]QOS16201.1 capsule biosynthesis protein CapA [Vibrio parahaemolyticus]HBC3498985.1 CapA family protein [Vibrio parahaemolyticus]
MSTKKYEYIVVSGDFFPSNGVITENNGNNELLKIYKNAKTHIVNLEAPITKSNKTNFKVGPNIKLLDSGNIFETFNINHVTLANNHICDYGIEGIKDTISVLSKYEITYQGIEVNGTSNYKFLDINGHKVAIFNFCEFEFCEIDDANRAKTIDPCCNYKEITECESDFKVVILHGGTEHSDMPNKWIRKIAKYYIDIGCDLVLCHHTHTVCGMEEYRGKEIYYGLGNFIFPKKKANNTWYLGISLQIKIDDEVLNTKVIPFKQVNNSTTVLALEGKDLDIFNKRFRFLCDSIKNDHQYEKYWENYYKLEHVNYLSSALNHSRLERGIFRKLGLRLKKFNEKLAIARLLNNVRCQSHRTIFNEVLKRRLEHK